MGQNVPSHTLNASSPPSTTTNSVVLLLKKLDLLFRSLIDRNNRLGCLLPHRTSDVLQLSTSMRFKAKMTYVTHKLARKYNRLSSDFGIT